MEILGIDIGGSEIKGAPVNVEEGRLLAEPFRVPTPDPATPEATASDVARLVRRFHWTGIVGCGMPSVVRRGRVYTAANIDDGWIGVDARLLFEDATGCSCHVLNDADAAGLAEMRFGSGVGQPGVVLVLTLGTGIGSALFVDGQLVPNTELGHLEVDGREAEAWAAARVREAERLGWAPWAARVDRFLSALERYLWPELIVIGGGISDASDNFLLRLTTRARLVPAALGSRAGIIGAATAAMGRGD